MARDDATRQRRSPAAVSDAADDAAGPDRRSVLRRSAATAAALGAPLLGACTDTTTPGAGPTDGSSTDSTDSPSTDDGTAVEEYARPERVAAAVEANEDLFATLDEVGIAQRSLTEGIRVTAYPVDGALRPEQRLYLATEFGVLTVVVSPEGAPFGPYADVVTAPAMMEDAPVEWPREMASELPDGRVVFRVDPDGWTEPGFGDPVELDDIPTVEDLCGSGSSDPREWECTGPTSDDECAYVNCCGHVEILDPSECPDNDGGDTIRFDPCQTDECGTACWLTSSGCECITLPAWNC